MSNFIIYNFGTFAETNRFKSRAIQGGFLETDLMYEHPPKALKKRKGIREIKKGGTETYSFYGLSSKTWKGKLKNKKRYRDTFKQWMEEVLSKPVHCVYLTGHHAKPAMWWDDGSPYWRMVMRKQKLRYNVRGEDKVSSGINIDPDNFQSSCRLVLGFGCDVASARNSNYYQKVFANGAQRPIVLGWDSTMVVPRESWASINEGFFDYLDSYLKEQKNAPTKEKLVWLYDNAPDEIVRAWGNAVSAYREGKRQKRLWRSARARDKNGNYFRFRWQKGEVVSVKK